MKEQLTRIYNVLNELYNEGYVPSGQIDLIKKKVDMVDIEIQINPGELGTLRIITKPKVKPLPSLMPTNVKELGYTGNVCKCGSHRMVRRGTCEYCEDCGDTSGCS